MAGDETAIRLRVQGEEDLAVISSLVQDAILPIRNIEWLPRQRRLVIVVHRYCWEREPTGEPAGEPASGGPLAGTVPGERVASALRFDGVLRLQSRGIDRRAEDQVAYLLGLQFRPGDGPGGELRLLCSDNAELAAELECLDGALVDVSRPWIAAGRPDHSGSG